MQIKKETARCRQARQIDILCSDSHRRVARPFLSATRERQSSLQTRCLQASPCPLINTRVRAIMPRLEVRSKPGSRIKSTLNTTELWLPGGATNKQGERANPPTSIGCSCCLRQRDCRPSPPPPPPCPPPAPSPSPRAPALRRRRRQDSRTSSVGPPARGWT